MIWIAEGFGRVQDDTLYSELEVTDGNNLFAYVPLIITRTTLMDMLEEATWCLE